MTCDPRVVRRRSRERLLGVLSFSVLLLACSSDDSPADSSTAGSAGSSGAVAGFGGKAAAGAGGQAQGGSGGSGSSGAAGSAGAGGSGTSGAAGSAGSSGAAGGGGAGGSGSSGTAGSAGVSGAAGSGGSGGSAGQVGCITPTPGKSYGKHGPSCPTGQTSCQGESCCEAFEVEGGTFPMGSCTDGCSDQPMAGYPHERPQHAVTVSSFYLDTYEVTVGRFRQFVAQFSGAGPQDGAGANPHVPGSGWKSAWNAKLPASRQLFEQGLHCDDEFATWTDSPAGNETLPINCVTWFEAFAFCAWDGGRLPTEAEWEYAAAGGSQNRLYPCGKPSGDIPAVYACTADGSSAFTCAPSDILPVGSRPKGAARWGHQDMAGGMFEWVLDWYDSDWYSLDGNDCHDCANLTPGIQRVQRGGSWDNDANPLRAAYRWFGSPSKRSKEVGVRCVRLP